MPERVVLCPVWAHSNFLRATRGAAKLECHVRHIEFIGKSIDVDDGLVPASFTRCIHGAHPMLAHVAERHGLNFAAFAVVSAARITHGDLPPLICRVLDLKPAAASP